MVEVDKNPSLKIKSSGKLILKTDKEVVEKLVRRGLSLGKGVNKISLGGSSRKMHVEIRKKKRSIQDGEVDETYKQDQQKRLGILQAALKEDLLLAKDEKKLSNSENIQETSGENRLETDASPLEVLSEEFSLPAVEKESLNKIPEEEVRSFVNKSEEKELLVVEDAFLKKTKVAKKAKIERKSGKLSVAQVLRDDYEEEEGKKRYSSLSKRLKKQERRQVQEAVEEKIIREVIVPDIIIVQELANRMSEKSADVVRVLIKLGMMVTLNNVIDADTAVLIVEEFGHVAKRVSDADIEKDLVPRESLSEHMRHRSPVVTVMGHVDHGKTSLLDALRKTDVVGKEYGGITQHIGAYQVRLPGNKSITFLDTPGHEAFTEMRSRGAKVTDIVVLVVAADDSVMPQTIEAIHHAQVAGVPIILAINKIDKPNADPVRVRSELLRYNVFVESTGGDVLDVEVSAKQGLNIDRLAETILLQAEMLDLKANANQKALATVIEAKMEKGRGAVATVLVRQGTLRVGDVFIAGSNWGRVRAMLDGHGKRLKEAYPSMPVEILGLNGIPLAGDEFIVVEDEEKAREVVKYRTQKAKNVKSIHTGKASMELMFQKIREGVIKELPVIVKTDVQGSSEAIIHILSKLERDDVRVLVIHSAVGPINESDITLASASSAVVIGFNVRLNAHARESSKKHRVDVLYFSVIYDIVESIKALMSGLLEPVFQENIIGHAEIKETYNISKHGRVGGCIVKEGVIRRGCKVRLLRDNIVIHTGDLAQLKRFKEDVREVKEGYECGMSFVNYKEILPGDVVECSEMLEIKKEWN